MRTAALVAVVLAVTSCAAFDSSVKRGDQLSEEGRWNEAMFEYEEAYERFPNSQAVQDRLHRARLEVAVDLARAAARAIEIRRLDRAERLVADALELAPSAPEVRRARELIAVAWAKEAEALLEEDSDVDRAFWAVDRAAEVDADAPGVRTTRNRIRRAYAESLRAQAESYEQEGLAAAALAALVRLSSLGRVDRVTEQRMTSLRSTLYEQASYAVELGRLGAPPRLRRPAGDVVEKILGLFPPEGCPNIRLVRRAPQGPGTRLKGELVVHSQDSSERQRAERHTYQSGTRTIPNPDFPLRVADVEEAERDMEEAVAEVQRLVEEVSRRESEVVMAGPADDVDSLRRDLERSRQHLEEAREEVRAAGTHLADMQEALAETPETLEEPVMTDEDLIITEVEKTFRVEIELSAEEIETGDFLWRGRRFEGTASAQASHHPGLEPAGIAPKPLSFEQSDDELREKALEELASSVQETLGELCRAHREDLRQNGLSLASVDDIPAATHWFALGIFYDPLGDLDSWDVDGRVRRFFQQNWQIEDPTQIIGN